MRRRRHWIAGLSIAVLALVLTLRQPLGWAQRATANAMAAEAAAIPTMTSSKTPVPEGMELGGYITNISDIDLLEDRFSVEMFIWSLWAGDPQSDPSDNLIVVNGLYDANILRFDKVRSTQINGKTWSLHRLRSPVVKRWQLKDYPFDEQVLSIEVGFDDPLTATPLTISHMNPISISPGLRLPGWRIKSSSAYPTSVSLMSDLGIKPDANTPIRRQSTVSFDVDIERRSLLYLAPDFLGYMLAIGLCCLSLVISRSRDDLILAAVISAASNYVYIAGKLPVTAMAGFIGNLQVIIFCGILYVIAADEILNQHIARKQPHWAKVARIGLLPSYLGITLLGVAMIIPPVST